MNRRASTGVDLGHGVHSKPSYEKAEITGANSHFEALLTRISGEFMVLGFLAFCVWVMNQSKGFYKLAEAVDHKPDYYSLLHLCEDVHMFLFLSMVANFCLAIYLIHTCAHWQVLFARFDRPELAEMYHIESYFNVAPPSFLKDEESWHKLKKYFIKTSPLTIDEDFDFARYLAACLDQILTDIINFSEWTWAMVLFITSINLTLAGAIEYSDIAGLPGVMWQQIVMACISPLLAIALSWHSSSKIFTLIKKSSNDDFSVTKDTWGETMSYETWLVRVMQALMYVVCYSMSHLVAAKKYWKAAVYGDDSAYSIWIFTLMGFYTSLYLAAGVYIFPEAVMNVTVAYAMPPYVDEDNKETLQACLDYDIANPKHWKKVEGRLKKKAAASRPASRQASRSMSTSDPVDKLVDAANGMVVGTPGMVVGTPPRRLEPIAAVTAKVAPAPE